MELFRSSLAYCGALAFLGMPLLFAPALALADDGKSGLGGSFDTVYEIEASAGVQEGLDIKEFIVEALKVLTGLVAVIALAVLVWGGVMYITSAGDENRAKQAKMLIMYAIVGLLLIGGAALIVNFVTGIYR